MDGSRHGFGNGEGKFGEDGVGSTLCELGILGGVVGENARAGESNICRQKIPPKDIFPEPCRAPTQLLRHFLCELGILCQGLAHGRWRVET